MPTNHPGWRKPSGRTAPPADPGSRTRSRRRTRPARTTPAGPACPAARPRTAAAEPGGHPSSVGSPRHDVRNVSPTVLRTTTRESGVHDAHGRVAERPGDLAQRAPFRRAVLEVDVVAAERWVVARVSATERRVRTGLSVPWVWEWADPPASAPIDNGRAMIKRCPVKRVLFQESALDPGMVASDRGALL